MPHIGLYQLIDIYVKLSNDKVYFCETAAPFDDSNVPIDDQLKTLYFQFIDIMRSALNKRFEQPGVKMLSDIENILLNAVNKEDELPVFF